jgi:hypothetical protein
LFVHRRQVEEDDFAFAAPEGANDALVEEEAQDAIVALSHARLSEKERRSERASQKLRAEKRRARGQKTRTVFNAERPGSWHTRKGDVRSSIGGSAWRGKEDERDDKRHEFLRNASKMTAHVHAEKRRASIAVAQRAPTFKRRASRVAENSAVTRDLRRRASKATDAQGGGRTDSQLAAASSLKVVAEAGLGAAAPPPPSAAPAVDHESPLPSGWLAQGDAASTGTYYYETKTRRATWTRPMGLSSFAEEDESDDGDEAGSAAAATPAAPAAPSSGGATGGIYTQRWDHASAAHYYEDSQSGRMSWTAPAGATVWRECWDEATQCCYYLNEVRCAASATPPPRWGGARASRSLSLSLFAAHVRVRARIRFSASALIRARR